VTTQAQQAAQGKDLGALGDALLLEGGEALSPELFDAGEDAGRVFFSGEAGG
jgi:hypothetical protein